MPRGRFLSKSISLDEKVNALSDDTARLLFTWLIPHLDREGRSHGDPTTVKSIVFPRRRISARKVDKYLNEMHNCGLLFRYSVNGNSYLLAPHFEKHQMGLLKLREAQSQIPPPTPELIVNRAGQTPAEVKGESKGKVQVDDNNNIIEELQSLSQWGDTHSLEDAQWLLEVLAEYPDLSNSHIKACRDYHSNKTKHSKALWKTRLRNWMKKDREFQKGGQSGTHRQGPRQLPQRDRYTRPEDLR